MLNILFYLKKIFDPPLQILALESNSASRNELVFSTFCNEGFWVGFTQTTLRLELHNVLLLDFGDHKTLKQKYT